VLINSVSETLNGVPTGFQHDAFVYIDDKDFVRHTAAFVRDGLQAGELVVAALPESRIAWLRSDLGSDADQVTFIDITAAGRNPASSRSGPIS
jgi:hypothetical protein